MKEGSSPAKIAGAFALCAFSCWAFALCVLHIKRTENHFVFIQKKIEKSTDQAEPLEYDRAKNKESNDIKFNLFN